MFAFLHFAICICNSTLFCICLLPGNTVLNSFSSREQVAVFRGERIVFWGPNTNTNIIRVPKNYRIRIRILFGLKKSPEYEYEYYSVWKNHPNTNTNIIRFENIDRIRIRIFWYSNIIRIIFEYRIIRSPLAVVGVVSRVKSSRLPIWARPTFLSHTKLVATLKQFSWTYIHSLNTIQYICVYAPPRNEPFFFAVNKITLVRDQG